MRQLFFSHSLLLRFHSYSDEATHSFELRRPQQTHNISFLSSIGGSVSVRREEKYQRVSSRLSWGGVMFLTSDFNFPTNLGSGIGESIINERMDFNYSKCFTSCWLVTLFHWILNMKNIENSLFCRAKVKIPISSRLNDNIECSSETWHVMLLQQVEFDIF